MCQPFWVATGLSCERMVLGVLLSFVFPPLEVDSQEPFIISLPELRYCRVLPERRQEKVSKTDGEWIPLGSRTCQVGFSTVLLDVPLQNTSWCLPCLPRPSAWMRVSVWLLPEGDAAPSASHCPCHKTLSSLLHWLNNLPRETFIKNQSFFFALNALLDYQNVPKKPVPKKTAVSQEGIRAGQRPVDFKLSQNWNNERNSRLRPKTMFSQENLDAGVCGTWFPSATKLLKLPRGLYSRELTLHTSGYTSSRLNYWDGLFWMGGTVGALDYF